MNRFILAGAALLATAGFALAQPADAPPPQDGGPAASAPAPGGPDGPEGEARGGPRERGEHGMRGGPGWKPHHKHRGMGPHGMMGMRPTKGAMFVFDQGRGGGNVVIKCADEDSTRSCAEAVQPMLNMMMQARQAAE